MAIASLRTTGCFIPLPMPKIALSGGLILGVKKSAPNMLELVTVKVPPETSSKRKRFSLAFLANSVNSSESEKYLCFRRYEELERRGRGESPRKPLCCNIFSGLLRRLPDMFTRFLFKFAFEISATF